MGMLNFAAREGVEIAAKTTVGKAAVEATERMLANVMELGGLKSIAREFAKTEARFYSHSLEHAVESKIEVPFHERLKAKLKPVETPLRIPPGFFGNGDYRAVIASDFGVSTQHLVPEIPHPNTKVLVGDTIAINPTVTFAYKERTLTTRNQLPQLGEVTAIHPKLDAETGEVLPVSARSETDSRIAVVRLAKKPYSLPNLEVTSVSPIDRNFRLWKNDHGVVFSAPANTTFDDPDVSRFKPLEDMRAVSLEHAEFVSGARSLPDDARRYIANNNALIEANAHNPETFLYALSSAPRWEFKSSPLLEWKSISNFNPSQLADNCMACTAAVLRTSRTGIFTTADEVAKVSGSPDFGKFDSIEQAFSWFKKAGGVRITNEVTDPAALEPGALYALTMKLDSEGELQHMAFAHKFKTNRTLFFDAQSGVQWDRNSLINRKTAVVFHKLEFMGD